MAECWSCGAERGDASFCTTCGKVQPLGTNVSYFDVLGVAPKMRIDASALEKAYFELSRKVHPDRFGRASPVERRIALEQTTILNDAYRTLRDPQKRGEYLMELEGVPTGKEESRTRDLDFLSEMLELQEQIERVASTGAGGERLAAMQRLRDQISARRDRILDSLARYFDERVGTRDATVKTLDELRYLRRLLERIDAQLEEMS